MAVAPNSRADAILAAGLGLCVAPLLLYAAASVHIRYINDDFCLASGARSVGAVRWAARMYVGWSGNVTTFLVGGLNELLGPRAQPSSFLLLFVLSWLAGFAALSRVLRERGVTSPRLVAALLVSSFVLAVVVSSPNPFQSVYWQAGRLVYLLPVQLSAVTLWLLVQDRIRGAVQALLVALVQAAASATSISYALIALPGLLVLRFALPRERARPFSAAATGAFVGLVVLIAAPGNSVRRSHFPPPDLSSALACTANGASSSVVQPWHEAPLPLLAVLALSAAVGGCFDRRPAPRRGWLLAGPVAVVAASVLAQGPACYAASTRLPDRALLVPNAFAIAFLAITSHGVGRALRSRTGGHDGRAARVAFGLLAALLAAASADGISRALDTGKRMATVAAAWDSRDRHIRERARIGKAHVLVPALGEVFDLPDLSPDPRAGENLCTAWYYSVDSVVLRPAAAPAR